MSLGGPFGYGGFGGLGGFPGMMGGYGMGMMGMGGMGFGGYPGGMNYAGSEYDIAKHPELDGVSQATWQHRTPTGQEEHDKRNFVTAMFGGFILLGLLTMAIAHRQNASLFKEAQKGMDTFTGGKSQKMLEEQAARQKKMKKLSNTMYNAVHNAGLRQELLAKVERYRELPRTTPEQMQFADDVWNTQIQETFRKFAGGKKLSELDGNLPYVGELKTLRDSMGRVKSTLDIHRAEELRQIQKASGQKLSAEDIQNGVYRDLSGSFLEMQGYLQNAKSLTDGAQKEDLLQRVRLFYESRKNDAVYDKLPEQSFTKACHDFLNRANPNEDEAIGSFLKAHENMIDLHQPVKNSHEQHVAAYNNFRQQLDSLQNLQAQAFPEHYDWGSGGYSSPPSYSDSIATGTIGRGGSVGKPSRWRRWFGRSKKDRNKLSK